MKTLITISSLIISLNSYAQLGIGSLFKTNKYKTTVIYTNNDTIRGYSKDFEGFKFYFNQKKKGRFKKIPIDEVKKIIVNQPQGNIEYYKITEKRKKKETHRLVKLLYDGKIKLYSHQFRSNFGGGTQNTSHSTPFGKLNITTTNSTTSFNMNVRYLQKKNEKYATDITMAKVGGRTDKSFRKFLNEYFSGCSELQNKIMSEKLKKNEIIEILEFYDNKCYSLKKQ